MIVKKGGMYVVKSHLGRSFGSYKRKEDAQKRLQQIEFFKRFKIEK